MHSTPTRLVAAAAAIFAVACDRGGLRPVQLPRLLTASTVEYPEDLWDAGVEDSTVLRLRIDTAGQVDSVVVQRPSRYRAFDSAAVVGARQLRFSPATRGGAPVAAWYQLPVRFRIGLPDSQPPTSP